MAEKKTKSAPACLEKAIECDKRGDLVAAVSAYEEALRSDRALRPANRGLALSLVRLGRLQDALQVCRTELQAGRDGEKWLDDRVVEAMQNPDLKLAGCLATISSLLKRGSEWHPGWPDERNRRVPDTFLSAPKLRHDLDQFRLLRELGALNGEVDGIIQAYVETLKSHAGLKNDARIPLTPEEQQRIGRTYGRIVHIADAPRLPAALSPAWDRKDVEHRYKEHRPGVVVIDDFLTSEALALLNRFCLESTVWSGNRYAHGRLGAFFVSGFNCPLLLQIAEEIRDAFPELIGKRYPLRQLWGFKNTCELPAGSTVHADFAAVNVNFWITDAAANLDDSSGGMVIYDVDAPLSWDFETYNRRSDVIRQFLAERQPGVIRVPYRQNRAIIFNSDLFHATEAVRFRPDYKSHRINVTMLYGDRKHDVHHPPPPISETSAPSVSKSWRSAAFGRSRF